MGITFTTTVDTRYALQLAAGELSGNPVSLASAPVASVPFKPQLP